MAEQWLSIVEYARTFGISDMTIRRRIRTGHIEAHLRDGKYYIPIETDPHTGEPLKQGAKAKHNAVAAPVKSHPNVDRSYAAVNKNHVERHEQSQDRRPVIHHLPHHQESRSSHTPNQNLDTRAQHHQVSAHNIDTRPSHRQDTRIPAPIQHLTQLPTRIAANLAAEQDVSVEAQALLEYCNSSLATARDLEHHIEARYLAKLETAAEQIRYRNAEIAKLQQQIEDLQLLVQILEKKRS